MIPHGVEVRPKAKPKGRRDVRALLIPEERHEVLDPTLEGKAERIGFEETYQLGWRKSGPVRIVVARAKYRLTPEAGPETIATTAMPPRTFPRLLAALSLLARIAVDKYCDGLPLHRQERRFAREGLDLDRGTMCRWMEDVGMTTGGVALAAKKHAFETAFCISTDATGIAIQPEPSPTQTRQPCRRGHFFVMVADHPGAEAALRPPDGAGRHRRRRRLRAERVAVVTPPSWGLASYPGRRHSAQRIHPPRPEELGENVPQRA